MLRKPYFPRRLADGSARSPRGTSRKSFGAPASALLLLFGTCALCAWVTALPAGAASLVGLELSAALEALRARGLEIVYTSRLVRSHMRVVAEPAADSPEEVLLAILEPHGLTIRDGADGRRVVVRRRREPEESAARGRSSQLSQLYDEIVVTSRATADNDIFAGRAVDEQDLASARHLDQDVFAGIGWLDDSAANGVSHLGVRGATAEEVMLVVDGQEVVEPYHLRDFGGFLGIVTPGAVGGMRLYQDVTPAAWGDRIGDVLEVITVEPNGSWRLEATAGSEGAQGSSSGALLGGRGRWLLAYRQGEPDVAREITEASVRPQYWDGFGKVAYAIGERHDLELETLLAHDDFLFTRSDFDLQDQFITDHESDHLWLRHAAVLGPRQHLEAALHSSEIRRQRFGVESLETPEEVEYAIDDQRSSDRVGGRLAASYQSRRGLQIAAGVEGRRLEVDYHYNDLRGIYLPFIDGAPQEEARFFSAHHEGWHFAAHATGRYRPPGAVSIDAALRYDRAAISEEDLLSPRVAVALDSARGGRWRLGWGFFHQPQRPSELRVPDGETELQRAERAEHRSLGWQRRWQTGLDLRLEIYQRLLREPLPRYENLYKPVSRFPEIEVDRVSIVAERSRDQGLELELRRRWRRLDGRVTYLWSQREDRLAGLWQPQQRDRRHVLRLHLAGSLAASWRFDVAWLGATGRPTTPLTVTGSGEHLEVVAGRYHGERLSAHHQLDVRVASAWRWRRLSMRLDLGIDNLYDRRHVRGFDTDFTWRRRPDGAVEAVAEPELAPGITPRWSLTLAY